MTREKLLGQARADLTALPDLYAELARTLTERNHDVSGYKTKKVVGSPAPLSIPVVHLADVRHKPGWWGDDPRMNRRRDRYGIAPELETWVRVVWEELPEIPDLTEIATVRSECATLVEHWDWITEQRWATELADDVQRITRTVRSALGEKPELKLKCPQCHNPAYMQPGGILACTEVPDHDVVVRDLEQQLRRRPALATRDICDEFDLEPGTLRIWKHRRKIRPARTEQHGRTERNWWLPWDVFCLVNPDIAEAIKLRDEIEAG